MEQDGTVPNSSAPYPRAATFQKLFTWHFNRGTRPKGSLNTEGSPWSRSEFAHAAGVGSDRAIGKWLNGESKPRDLQRLLDAFFGDNPVYAAWRTDLRVAVQDCDAMYDRAIPETGVPTKVSRLNILRPYNYEDHGIISRSQIELRGARDGTERSLQAQLDFYERLYVEGQDTRVEFGVARAFLSIKAMSGVAIKPVATPPAHETVRFLQQFRDSNFAFSINPRLDAVSIGEGALPCDGDNNRLCTIASLPDSASARDLQVSVYVRLNTEGIAFFDGDMVVSDQKVGQMLAVLKAAITKRMAKEEGCAVYPLTIDDEEVFQVVAQ